MNVMSQQAIIVPYCIDQNAPSKPLTETIIIPDEWVDLKEALTDMWLDHFEDIDAKPVAKKSDKHHKDFGDFYVGDGSSYLYVTLITKMGVPVA